MLMLSLSGDIIGVMKSTFLLFGMRTSSSCSELWVVINKCILIPSNSSFKRSNRSFCSLFSVASWLILDCNWEFNSWQWARKIFSSSSSVESWSILACKPSTRVDSRSNCFYLFFMLFVSMYIQYEIITLYLELDITVKRRTRWQTDAKKKNCQNINNWRDFHLYRCCWEVDFHNSNFGKNCFESF